MQNDQNQLVEALRQEVWRWARRTDEAVAAEQARDGGLLREVEQVREAVASLLREVAVLGAREEERAVAAAAVHVDEAMWAVADRVVLYLGTARSMAAMALCHVALGENARWMARWAALLTALLLDPGVVLLIFGSTLGSGGWSTIWRLVACWRRRRGAGTGAGGDQAETATGGGGGWGAWFWGSAAGGGNNPA